VNRKTKELGRHSKPEVCRDGGCRGNTKEQEQNGRHQGAPTNTSHSNKKAGYRSSDSVMKVYQHLAKSPNLRDT
jgi:hypothetical protein